MYSLVSLQKSSHPKLFPGDIVEYRRNKYFSHFGVYYGDRDGVPYVAHLTCRGTNSLWKINLKKIKLKKHKKTQVSRQVVLFRTDSNAKLPLFGRALRSEVKLDPLEMLGTNYKVTRRFGGKKTKTQKLIAKTKPQLK